MIHRIGIALSLFGVCTLAYLVARPVEACCPAGPKGKPVVNADQTVIILWDAANKMQHFIRQASFKSEADDFGFIVPSPSQPELDESGNDAFPFLLKLTEPEIKTMPRPSGGGCGCTKNEMPKAGGLGDTKEGVKVLQQKLVAGFDAAVLETKSAAALIEWLKDNGYAYSPEIEAWAKPYVEGGWKFTALKVAREKDAKDDKGVKAGSLRISFKTERPLFPYREPDYKSAADSLGAKRRLLRIYFLADARYDGELTKETTWTGKVAWAGKISAESRGKILTGLKLAETTGPSEWWLTEFEDEWPYKVAPADVYFARSPTQQDVRREPIIRYVAAPFPRDGAVYALVAVAVIVPVWNRLRRREA